MVTQHKPVPGITPDSLAFWTGGNSGELLISQCGECGWRMQPPSPICLRCHSREVAPKPVSGLGRLHTYTLNCHKFTEAMEVPFVFAVVELDEQARLFIMTNIVDCDPDKVHIGMRVRVRFEKRGPLSVPLFAPEP